MHMSTTTNGEYRLCCRSKKVGDYTAPPKDVWKSTEYNEVRNNLLTGVRDERCNACWKLEDKGIVSLRQSQNFSRVNEYKDLVKSWQETGQVDWNVPVIELKLSNICNLRCRMCWPKDSTPWIKDWDKVKDIHDDGTQDYIERIMTKHNLRKKPVLNLFADNQAFVDQLIDNLPNVTELEFAGGEPLLDPLHFRIIDEIPNPENVVLKYSTNLTDLEFKNGRNILDIWKRFKGVRLTISIDGYEELNNKIRYGTDWSKVRQNIRDVKDALGDKLLTIRATTTISAMNAEHLIETMRAVVHDLGIAWHTSRLTSPEFLHANVIHPTELREQIKRLTSERDNYQKLLDDFESYEKYLINYHMKEHDLRLMNALVRHLTDSIKWLEMCIDDNKHDVYYAKYKEYMQRLDESEKD